MTCPDCDGAAAYHSERGRHVVSALGPLAFDRSYYYCRRCSQGFTPFDLQAGFTNRQLTPAAERLATLAGATCESFERGADHLEEMAGIRLSESTVERTTRTWARDSPRCSPRSRPSAPPCNGSGTSTR